ncbi:peptide ABC transporter substrate-binding protein [Pilimelia anulata]|uniref:Peptide ABC transporter substrate-binding protein n=1 Tax=Pilimelia anulata TaxID=53371 RepID=A0A8J3BB98_9ACTN|nr:ABC transporter substrate-binding protein [Pilimelia anulata]GGK09666.1 peptide ABC transporter substrate-binding protein [Pilimelia anulata]
MNHKLKGILAGSAVLALTASLAACGDKKNEGGEGEFNAALTAVFNPSTEKGGTVKVANADDWDSVDPGDTYYGYSWNFLRLYGRALLMFKPAPGKEANELVPDLAEDLGKASDGGKTWTYKIRKGQKYDDGTEIKAQDVKYAVLRSMDKVVLPHGPQYFEQFLDIPRKDDKITYKGPYKDPKANTDFIQTPDDYTVVFKLRQAFADFDYLAMLPQTVPVPQAKDTGSKYKEKIVSSGPYKFEKYESTKSFTLVRNDQWDPASDPNRKALPDRWEVSLKVNADDLDNRIQSGDVDFDVQGTGVQTAMLARVVGDPKLKARTDNPTLARLWYTSIPSTVPPFDKIECRRAVLYAADRTAYQAAYGGELAGGELASTILPPIVPGYQKYDLYPAGQDNKGDVEKAKEELKKCGQPNGFETNMAFRSDRAKEKATAEALQESLQRVGIKLNLKPFPSGDYFAQYAGNPSYVVNNKIGLATNGWGADFNTPFGFLSQIVDSRVILPGGGSSNVSVRSKEIDKMIDEALVEQDKNKQYELYSAIDKKVMEEAFILPGVYAKSLLLRPQNLTNVFVSDSYNMYDYVNLGVAKK